MIETPHFNLQVGILQSSVKKYDREDGIRLLRDQLQIAFKLGVDAAQSQIRRAIGIADNGS